MGSIFSRRNALIGWAALTFGRWLAMRKAAEVVEPPKRKGKVLLTLGAVTALGVAVGGGLAFWRRSQPDNDGEAA